MSHPSPIQKFTADGATAQFQYTFNLPGGFSAVFVWTQAPGEGASPVLSLAHTHNKATKTITFAENPAAGTLIWIIRFTNRTRQSMFIGGQTLTAASQNHEPDRLTAVTQEIEAGIGEFVVNEGPTNLSGPYLAKNPEETAWQGQALPSINCAPATSGLGWVTLDQAIGLLTGGNPTFIDNSVPWCWTGDGETTLFPCLPQHNPGNMTPPKGFYKTTSFNVYVAHVPQSMCPDDLGQFVYEVVNVEDEEHTYHETWAQFQEDGDFENLPEGYYEVPEIRFDTAPEDGTLIEARFVFGTAQVTLPDQIFTSKNISQGAVQVPFHIAPIGPDDWPLRVLRFAANGNPSISRVFADWVDGFNAKVRTNRLDQMAVPDANVSMNSRAIVNVATPGPSSPAHHAATKGYVDQQVAGAGGGVDPLEFNVMVSQITGPWINIPFMPRSVVFIARQQSTPISDDTAHFAGSNFTDGGMQGAWLTSDPSGDGSNNMVGTAPRRIQRRFLGGSWQYRIRTNSTLTWAFRGVFFG